MAKTSLCSNSLVLLVMIIVSTTCTTVACPVGCQCQPTSYWQCRNINIRTIIQAGNTSHVRRLSIDNTYHGLDDQILPANAFGNFQNLITLELILENLQVISQTSFQGLDSLQDLAIIGCRKLSTFPVISGLSNLQKVIIRETGISEIPKNAFHTLTKLSNIQLNKNRIHAIHEFVFNQTGDKDNGLTINLASNPLSQIHPKAFEHLVKSAIGLISLDISNTQMHNLPTPSNTADMSNNGLKNLRQLQANTKTFKRLPLPRQLPRVRKIQVHYSYLCCIFHRHQSQERPIQSFSKRFHQNQDDSSSDSIPYDDSLDEEEYDNGARLLPKRKARHQDDQVSTAGDFVFPTLAIPTKSDTGIINQGGGGFSGNTTTINGNITDLNQLNANSSHSNCTSDQIDCPDGYGGWKLVECTPEPNVLTPCEDMLGEWYLKIPEWIMSSIALFANFLVIIVIVNAESHLSVTKFLVCNLAFADFCMGIYLTIMAIADAATSHQYANYAIDWQTGSGCSIAGFIAIFSAELSTMTLTIITIERYLAIVHAMYYEKQLKLSGAFIAMSISWLLAITLAILPNVGVNTYSTICICLPADFSNPVAEAYIIALVAINGLAFILIVYCYIVMYYTVHSTHTSGGNTTTQAADRRIARRMALLVFSNFACWTPIAFFGLTSILKLNLITVTGAKFLMVFIFPINATANPFLYSIFNQLFRKDLHHVVNKWKSAWQSQGRTSGATANATLSQNAAIKNYSTAASFVSDNRKRQSSVSDRLLSSSILSGLARILKVSNSSENITGQQLNGSNSSRNICETSQYLQVARSTNGRSSIDSQNGQISNEILRHQKGDRNNGNVKATRRYSKALKCNLSDIQEVSNHDPHQNSTVISMHHLSKKSPRPQSIETVV